MSPSPIRQKLLKFVTPKIADFVVIQLVDPTRIPIPEKGTAHPDSRAYPNHLFAHAEVADDQGVLYKYYYVAEREHQDLYNWEFTRADIGGTRFDAVKRTYVTVRDDFDPYTPDMGDEMPDSPAGLFTGSHVLAERGCVRTNDEVLDSLFVIETRVYVKRCTQRIVRDDEETDDVLTVESNLYYYNEVVSDGKTIAELFADEDHAFWNLTNGIQNEGRQLSCAWYEVTSTRMVPDRPAEAITGTSSTGIPLRSYATEDRYLWPAVLRSDGSTTLSDGNCIAFKIIPLKDRPDTDRILPRVMFANPTYSGPTKMLVEEWWVEEALGISANPLASGGLPESAVMIPREIEYSGANYNLRIEPCLSPGLVLIDNIGTNDETYELGSYGQTFPTTAPYTDWPTSLIASVDQRPFRGGYKVTVITAYRPDHWVPAA